MKKVLVLVESKGTELKRSSYEAITAAHSLGVPVVGVALGSGNGVATAGEYGLTECVVAEHALLNGYSSQAAAKAIVQIAQSEGTDVVVIAANSTGKELAPRVAVLLNAGLLADSVAITNNGGTIHATRPVFAGKARQTVKAATENVVVTLRPNVFTPKKAESQATVAVRTQNVTLDDTDRKVVVKEIIRNEGKLDVLEADIIVSGGRGLKGPENFHLVEALASKLGAAVGASRAVVDAGWRPHNEQVGQTGKTVSPSLYVACGISGAVQHLAGMSSSKVIVAINKDKDAPIFKVADYGIIGDVFDVLPKLTTKVGEITGKN
ncbi:MAG: electron transfer flavoprotein subunit alpha/FixB family protein [Candidatus Kapabacteria bacterium]|nr:electron transfer flavoprotein subunit alpha/FixB family protein [Candidatus Kapabacteria bacterium]